MTVKELIDIPECQGVHAPEKSIYEYPCGLRVAERLAESSEIVANAELVTEAHQHHHDAGHLDRDYTITCYSLEDDEGNHSLCSAECTCEP